MTFKTIRDLFTTKKQKNDRRIKDLLRENLSLLAVDVFYIDDPKIGVPPDKLVEYYKKFFDICRDKDVMERIRYLINKQALITLEQSKEGLEALGSLNINGMATVKDDFERLGNLYLQEMPRSEEFNRYEVI